MTEDALSNNEENRNIVLFCLDYALNNATQADTQEQIKQAKDWFVGLVEEQGLGGEDG
jgi:hypothetical protein